MTKLELSLVKIWSLKWLAALKGFKRLPILAFFSAHKIIEQNCLDIVYTSVRCTSWRNIRKAESPLAENVTAKSSNSFYFSLQRNFPLLDFYCPFCQNVAHRGIIRLVEISLKVDSEEWLAPDLFKRYI